MDTTSKIIIIGGGLAGLCAAIHLAKNKSGVLLIEKNEYPRHKVCGEYVSNEVLPYLEYLGFNPFDFGAKNISEFELSTRSNKKIRAKLPLGGFGISRYEFDYQLYKIAKSVGVRFKFDTANAIEYKRSEFVVTTKSKKQYLSEFVIGAFGKRSSLDVNLKRSFIKKRSPYLAVKIHVQGHFPEDKVALHNFKGGYCGVSKVENNSINLCYISSFDAFKRHKNIDAFQKKIVFKNKSLEAIFQNSKPVFDQPLTISQISFETKAPIENHILMCGDSAGMIHPLCGNGMGMAIRSAQLAAQSIIDYFEGRIKSRDALEQQYSKQWQLNFKWRLRAGHTIAYLFRNTVLASLMLNVLRVFPFLIPKIIKTTHGKPMEV